MRARAQSTVRVFDRDAGGSEMATVDKTYPRSECPPASPPYRGLSPYNPRLRAAETKTWIRGSSPRKTTLTLCPAVSHNIFVLFQAARAELSIQPYVFHAPTVGDAVDHHGQTFHPRLPAGRATGIKEDRTGAVFRQRSVDLPYQ